MLVMAFGNLNVVVFFLFVCFVCLSVCFKGFG